MKLRQRIKGYVFLFTTLALIFACGSQPPAIQTPSVFIPLTPTPIPTPALTPTTSVVENQFGSSVPQLLREQVSAQGTGWTLDISNDPTIAPNEIQIQWVYALVAPFPTIRDDVTFTELRAVWSGDTEHTLLLAESTRAAFKALWGEPASGSVRSVEDGSGGVIPSLLDTAWAESTWAIIPFEDLAPRWKVLTVDGQSPIRKGFDVADYPLVVPFTLQASGTIDPVSLNLFSSNYDASKLTTVMLTGVTALVRATAFRMEKKGITYPGEEVRELLREADIAHISNEIPFLTGCPFPDPNSGRLVFCSDSKYMGLLTDVGVDVVELTGNHFADYGRAAMEETLAIYRSNNIPYYGGGADLQDSFQPALFEINGSKIAFLGCNMPDVDSPKVAAENRSGAAPCDFDYLTARIAELKAQGYLVIFTFQWFEDYYPAPSPKQMRDFQRVADAGATIVSGSQAHFPKTMEFYNDAFIHYGLGNLFFDQMGNLAWMPEGIRREFLDRYVIYSGKLVSVELTTTLLEDFARPRLMTPEERAAFLSEYFTESGWQPITDLPAPNGTSVP
jgi:hypothetical protein